jgi:hypothetical protein
MLVVETIAKIRRLYFGQSRPIKMICRELGLLRKVVRKVVRTGKTEFHYARERQLLPKIGPWRERLDAMPFFMTPTLSLKCLIPTVRSHDTLAHCRVAIDEMRFGIAMRSFQA